MYSTIDESPKFGNIIKFGLISREFTKFNIHSRYEMSNIFIQILVKNDFLYFLLFQ
jgi:hypothetical protein